MTDEQRNRLMDEYEAAVIEVENRREDLVDAEWDWENSRSDDEQVEANVALSSARYDLTDALRRLESIKRQFPECREEAGL